MKLASFVLGLLFLATGTCDGIHCDREDSRPPGTPPQGSERPTEECRRRCIAYGGCHEVCGPPRIHTDAGLPAPPPDPCGPGGCPSTDAGPSAAPHDPRDPHDPYAPCGPDGCSSADAGPPAPPPCGATACEADAGAPPPPPAHDPYD